MGRATMKQQTTLFFILFFITTSNIIQASNNKSPTTQLVEAIIDGVTDSIRVDSLIINHLIFMNADPTITVAFQTKTQLPNGQCQVTTMRGTALQFARKMHRSNDTLLTILLEAAGEVLE